MIDLGHRLKRDERILRQEVSGSVVLFSMENGRYYSLNDVATRAWDLCDGTRSVSEILAIVADEYDAPEKTIHEDVTNLFLELCDERLLVEVNPAS